MAPALHSATKANGVSPGRRLLRSKAAAEYLGISPWKLRALIADRQIPFVQIGLGCPFLLDIEDLNRWIEENKKFGDTHDGA